MNEGRPVDFLYIGANSGQQTIKACSDLARLVMKDHGRFIAFVPEVVRVRVEPKREGDDPVRRAMLLRTIEVEDLKYPDLRNPIGEGESAVS